MNKKIIRNARIITMNERLDILPNGNILIENGKISAITTQSLEDTDAEITDAEGMFLLPGLINTCLLYTSPSPRDLSTSRMPSSA